ncbi:MAG: transglycosylase SLT domain-containing protein [Deltaproteobacteria bacterium]|nr:transglycosylase SLT domain-containing protein [Deltaproteobacteria bacterium]
MLKLTKSLSIAVASLALGLTPARADEVEKSPETASTSTPSAAEAAPDATPEPAPAQPRSDEAAPAAEAESGALGSSTSPDDTELQENVAQGAAELEALRKAEEKAGLLPSLPGQGPLDGLTTGVSSWNPLARDLQSAQGRSLAGTPLADPLPAEGATIALAELSGISPEELRAKYDIPVELNAQVVAYIRFFQTDARPHFEKWLARSSRWSPGMRAILEKEGVPLDLVYLSMIESGFNPYAYSPAKASGLWQFVVGTSRRYGLLTDFWVDERRDPLKATLAAAHYLADLKERFHGDWYLAWAGYNAGEGKIEKAIKRESTVDFWRMSARGHTLRAETKHYVPKLIAAALIAKHPERFGFKVDYEPVFTYEEAVVSEATDLRALAKAAGSTIEELRLYNPSLRRFCTPPGPYTLRLPPGTKERFEQALAAMDKSERLSFAQHKIERGESLAKIARAYGVTEAQLLKTNGFKSFKQARTGTVLVVPLSASKGLAKGSVLDKGTQVREIRSYTASPSANYEKVRSAHDKAVASGRPDPADEAEKREQAARAAAAKAAAERRARIALLPKSQTGVQGGVYVVQPGDSLWSIANKVGVSVDELKRINRMSKRQARALQVGQAISVKES